MPTVVTHRQVSIRATFRFDEWTTDDHVDFGSHRPRPDDRATPPPDDGAGAASTSLPDRRKQPPRTLARCNSAERAIDRRDEP